MVRREGTTKLTPVCAGRAGQRMSISPMESPPPWAVLPPEQQSRLAERAV
jgi:hypothetical protein